MRLILIFLFLPFAYLAQTTDEQLLNVYITRGELDKALPYAEKIYDRSPNKTNFLTYYKCLIGTENLKDAEKELRRQVQANPYDYDFPILLGSFYEENNEIDKANKTYDKIIDDLPGNSNSVVMAFNAFRSKNKNDYALKVLQKGDKLLRGTYPLQMHYADYYGAIGETNKMLDTYVDLLEAYPSYISYVQNMLARKIDFTQDESKEYEHLKNRLLADIQKKPNDYNSYNLLVWLFTQRKNFDAALTQVIAMDKRRDAAGTQVYELGIICLENQAYSTAREAFKYVIDMGSKSPYYFQAEMAYLNTSYTQIVKEKTTDQSTISETISAYKKTINRLLLNARSAALVKELAHIEAFYAQQPDSAIFHLEKALALPGLTDMTKAELKMELADIQVLNDDIWGASILYMQIDKDFKFEVIGEEAKFKNARIFYFDGEFEFAQSQLDILKQATSKLIANDAMRLSLLITENYGLDSNYEAMLWFAKGDLFVEQQQYDLAFTYFDSILTEYDYSPLGDEILMKKSEAFQKQGKWTEAIQYLEEVLKKYQFDILADDAVFQLGEIYERHLFETDKAAEYYKKILFEYKGSLHSNEARKRYRILRGDKAVDSDS